MSQSNNQYRLFFKKRTNIEGKSITSYQLKVRSFNINRDLLTKTTSTFEVLEVPSAIEDGDIVGCYDIYGTIIFLGTVAYIQDNRIEATQMNELFDDNWLWNNPLKTTLEETLKQIVVNDYQNTSDTLMKSIYDCFEINTTTSTNQSLETQDDNFVINFSTFLYDIYEKYSILFDFNISFNESTPSINIGVPNYNKLQIGDNALIFRNFDVTTNVFETNKLIIYSQEGVYRETWYATTSGITNNAGALNRLQQIKTRYIFSDDDINVIKASNLRNYVYNHEITCEMVLDNKLLSINDIHLGQEIDLYINGNYYNTILTGYSLNMTEGVDTGLITLKFGLVRTTLTSKIYKRLGSQNGN